MFKLGYYYKYKLKNRSFTKKEYNQITKWNKCIKIDIDRRGITYGGRLSYNINTSWNYIGYRHFQESKYNPDIKRKLRKILEK